MCIEQLNAPITQSTLPASKPKLSYSLKRLLKQLFKSAQKQQQQQLIAVQNLVHEKKANSVESLESVENSRNASLESEAESISLESFENDANERLAAAVATAATGNTSSELEDYDFADISSIPVHFLRTSHGTFFWTAEADIVVDNDLITPLDCCTNNQLATPQLQDRWAQA